ncbi:ABC transporter-related protein [Calothrix sp. NIES-4071]|nr:ABC transporter-related protein [Calothrix sp. NIES-4071]BAZ56762.1 ABC transporter-related protein [Calothrix sp. NIES-4105]
MRGQLYTFKGNQPILLDNSVWIVQSGSFALFAVTVKNGVIEGTRRYLCSINQGEALFGTAFKGASTDCHRHILAAPMEETKLLQLNQEFFCELIAHADVRAVALVESWLQRLSTALSFEVMPAIQVKASGQARFSLNKGETFQPESGVVSWIRVTQGIVRFLDVEEITFTTQTAIPLTDKIWLEALEEVQLANETTEEIRNWDTILTGLSLFHTQFLHYIDYLDRQEAEEEIVRLRGRQRLNRQVTVEALGELASTLQNYQDGDFFNEGTPLLVAAGAVGRALGIKILPPSRSLDPKRVKEPLEAIARSSRIRMRQVLLRDNWWEKDCGPLLAYTKENQPVALLPVSATSYEIFNPIEQTRTRVDKRIASTLAAVAYMFYRSLPDKTISAFALLKFALKGRTRDILSIFGTGIGVTLLGMLTPQATAVIMDNAIPDSDKGLLLQIGLGLLVAALSTTLFQLSQGFAILRIETISDASTQVAVWDRLLKQPVSFFRQYTTGDLTSRVSSVSTIRRQLGSTTLINLLGSFFGLFYLAQLFHYNSKLAFVALAIAFILIAVTTISGLLLLRKVRPLLECKGKIFGQTVQLINGISKVHIAGAQERAFASWSKNYSQQIKLELSTQQIEDTIVLFNTVMPILTNGVLFWFTIQLLDEVNNSGVIGLSLGTFLAFNAAYSNFIKCCTDLSNTVAEVLRVIPQWKRTQPILASIPEVNRRHTDPGKLIGRIVVDNLSFRYRQDGQLILNNINISAEPGEFIALVGSSGSGKSTMLRLLLGFETPDNGSIFYDGQDLSGLDVDAVRRQLGVVLQNGRLMSASIYENIAGGAQITLEEAWEAARMSGFADDIINMPMQMHTVVSEGGGNISGGQRQRLLIARALALKPRILLFDEATSALDNRTQAIVSESLDKLQVTRIAIAHRLSTIRNAHRIYVLQAGRVVQQGNFEELASVEGLFAQLMARQMTT